MAKANADAEWPEGHDVDWGIVTWRAIGTSYIFLSGRRRWPSGLSTKLTTADVSAMDADPFAAARRPRLPPQAASSAEQPSHSRDLSAAWESRRNAASSAGVGVDAIAA